MIWDLKLLEIKLKKKKVLISKWNLGNQRESNWRRDTVPTTYFKNYTALNRMLSLNGEMLSEIKLIKPDFTIFSRLIKKLEKGILPQYYWSNLFKNNLIINLKGVFGIETRRRKIFRRLSVFQGNSILGRRKGRIIIKI